ncbi:ABC transporter ATP-binding protein [Actinobacteria bacterium YIM 96077]|uniref:Glycerol-3-phosphate ABC transporter ATP-binding protein n=1 Tax=Phytoactinopolyspora halophila TaxID=1981511 RepID=A0A329QYW2_9ACTN|nr:ABC transporter ATP-binding protein [Phytoactinopolyspora halophila]AYY13181.1 ABC transporter ATP-binding protein [Actinobacteria bacterium YIM 96077]RAW17580.1 glycerol-3-phosphate ABC transporter ATP-binding protein [Phytoactinopolyspora halophila]
MAKISLRDVEKSYGSELVLRDCNLDIDDHEFVVLVGPSGSGKTTLLRIIAGLEPVSGGDVYFDDVCVNNIDVGDRDIAMVFQNYGLYPHKSVYENMAFGLRRRKISKSEIDERVRQAGELLGIGDLLRRRPKQLSGGQRQRVALGRAIVRDPSAFLLDEPLSNLDAHLRVQMRAEILKVHKTVTATAVYVTHDQVEALTMGDRIVVMRDGMIQQVGTPDHLYDYPANRFVAGFIGTPAMGFLRCSVRRSADGDTELVSPGVQIPLPRERAAAIPADVDTVEVGVRPERLYLDQTAARSGTLSGTVEMVEQLGSEYYVHVNIDDAVITARTSRDQRVEIEESVKLTTDGAYAHLFDVETGAAYA